MVCKVPSTRIIHDQPFQDEDSNRFMHTLDRAGMKVDFYLHRMNTPEFYVVTASAKVFVPAFPPNIQLVGHNRYQPLPQKLGLVDREWTLADMPADPLLHS